jgi:Secretion system C-terminal sorting domain
MKKALILFSIITSFNFGYSQELPPRVASPINIKQIHSGHSLTDPLFSPNWPGQFVNLIGSINSLPSWQLFDSMVGKSTIPGSSLKARWENPPGFGSPDAKLNINNWQLLSITERVPLLYEGGNTQQWYLDGIQEQKQYLSLFVNNAWNNGNNGNGTPTLLWTTWTNIDNSDGPWRQMLDIQGAEFERMQDYANLNRPAGAPPVYIIPGHKMMARLYDDIQQNIVPGITNINQFFGDNIHTNELGAYAVSMIHYATIFKQSPVGLPINLLPDAPAGTPRPSQALATYLQNMVWNVVNNYPRAGFAQIALSLEENEIKKVLLPLEINGKTDLKIYPNPANDYLIFEKKENINFTIFNNSGTEIMSGKSTSNKIDVQKLLPSQYFLKIDNQFYKFYKN